MAVAQAHRAHGYPAPTDDADVRAVWGGIRRRKGTAQVGKAAAVTAQVRRMLDAPPADTAWGVHDRALLLVGFAGALRRSELVALDVGDVDWTADGLVVTIRRSRTDQEGAGATLGIPYGRRPETCPVRRLRAWPDRARLGAGPIFRPVDRHGRVLPRRLTDRAVALAVKRAASGPGRTRPATPATRCAPAWPPPRRWPAPRSATS